MNKVYLLLGANKGDRERNLSLAAGFISGEVGEILQHSSVYETAAWGKEDQPAFLNEVLLVNTALAAKKVLEKIFSIEHKMGRVRAQKWAQRIIDIDILFYNHEVINEKDLIVPHPFIHERRFTLVPLVEIAPGLVHPVLKRTMRELLDACPDKLEVRTFKPL